MRLRSILLAVGVALPALLGLSIPAHSQAGPATTSTTASEHILPAYDQPTRGQFHFSPPKHWINDPNGLIYYRGQWHMFYQYYPNAMVWGPMHWGHAVSTDLVHWKVLPVALYPDRKGYIFTGSVVVDWNNSSGFFPSGNGLVAVFTYSTPAGRQSQAIAYSRDAGLTWTKYSGNPVIPNPGSLKDFRDPYVFWYPPTRRWDMVVAGGQVRFYSSPDLKHWTLESIMPNAYTECPGLFAVPVQGGGHRWVLSYGGTKYQVGRFNGHRFTPTQSVKRVDLGDDFYAAQSWNNAPHGRRIWIGWMNNWAYAQQTPVTVERSEMTVPRELTLIPAAGGFDLAQHPVRELQSLAGPSLASTSNRPIPAIGNVLRGIRATSYEISATLDIGTAATMGFTLRDGTGQRTVLEYDNRQATLSLDRRQSGDVSFSAVFADRSQAVLPLERGRLLQLHILVDRSSVEVFANNGRAVITDQIFPHFGSNKMSIYATGGTARIVNLTVRRMHSIWTR